MTELQSVPVFVLRFLLGFGALLAGCAESGVRFVESEAVKADDLPVCRAIHVVDPDFGLDEQMYRSLDITADGVISSDGSPIWRRDTPKETADLKRTLEGFAKGMVQEDGFPDGWLVIRAHRETSYEVIDFLLQECRKPPTGIWKFDFAVRGTEEGVQGILGASTKPDALPKAPPVDGRSDERVELLIEGSVTPGGVVFSMRGEGDMPERMKTWIQEESEGLRDSAMLAEVIRKVILSCGPVWGRMDGDLSWGTVIDVVGAVVGDEVTRGPMKKVHRWNRGFLLQR